MSEEGTSWSDELHRLLSSSETDDESIVDFIETSVPEDEGKIFDHKKELYLSADDDEDHNERRGKLVKLCNALANVTHSSENRYIFVGFTDEGFVGIEYQGALGGDHIVDVDDAKIQDLLNGYLDPVPEVKRYQLSVDEEEGCVLEIERAGNRPVLIDESVRVAEGKETVVYEGQAYTRKGSRTTLMRNPEYRELIERRKEILSEVMEGLASDLGKAVTLPTEQLENLDLRVQDEDSDDALSVEEVITTSAATDFDERLNTAVKHWNSTGGPEEEGELLNNRRSLYHFYNNRDKLDLTDEKLEFLFRSCLDNHQIGAEWIMRYDGGEEELFREIIDEQRSAATILSLEKVLLSIGNKDMLQAISEDKDLDYRSSEAEEYIRKADRGDRWRVTAYCGSRLSCARVGYKVSDFFNGKEDPDQALDEILEILLEKGDISTRRTALREIEMIRLAKES